MCYCCVRIGDNCLIYDADNDIIGISGDGLRQFIIAVGPNDGEYKKCGSSRNKMLTDDTTAFMCEPHATGNSVTIQLKRLHAWLTLCEVFIFGTGMLEVNRCIATNTLQKHFDLTCVDDCFI